MEICAPLFRLTGRHAGALQAFFGASIAGIAGQHGAELPHCVLVFASRQISCCLVNLPGVLTRFQIALAVLRGRRLGRLGWERSLSGLCGPRIRGIAGLARSLLAIFRDLGWRRSFGTDGIGWINGFGW
jgi:hypothetical protein